MVTASSLQEYATHAAAVLGADAEASICIRQHGATLRAASSTDAAGRCDQAQAMSAEGPGIDAMAHLTIYVVPEIASERRWQAWRERATTERFRTAVAVPARVGDGTAVALGLYAHGQAGWDQRVLASAGAYARLVATTVRARIEAADVEEQALGLSHDLSDAAAIERAVGVIMQTNGCTAQEAEQILGRASVRHDASRRQVAETILRALGRGRP
jgi:hypothetical protein